MPKPSCCVPGCPNSFPKAIQGTTCYPFPKDEDLAKKWMSRIGRRGLEINESAFVCSNHFKEKDFTRSLLTGSSILKLKAVPSIFKGEKDEKMSRGKENCKNNGNQVDNLDAANSLEAKINSETKACQLSKLTLESIRNFEHKDLDCDEATNFSEELIENSQVEAKVECVFLDLIFDVLKVIFIYLSSNDLISLSSVCKRLQWSVQELKSFDFSAYYSLNTELLGYALSTSCRSINLNHCYWLKPKMILNIISKTKLVHFHVIECDVNEDVIKAICNLHLISLSFSYTEEWQSYFQAHLNRSFSCFKNLNNLEVFDNAEVSIPNTILFSIYETVLHHCKALQHLRVFASDKSITNMSDRLRLPPFSGSSPVPKLKSLVIDIKDTRLNLERILIFLNLILNDKEISLEHFDIGDYTCKLYSGGFLPHPKISIDKSTLLLRDFVFSNNNRSDFNFWTNFAGFKDVITQTNYKKIYIRGILSEGVDEFFQNVIPNSCSSLKELNVDFNFSHQLFNSLSFILIQCPQITVLDVSELLREYSQNILVHCFQQQIALLDAISNLTNLKVLNMHCHILHCNQGGQFPKTLPFWKVTKACSKLIELRILNGLPYRPNCNIDENVLYDIAHCKNLRLLRLMRFNIISNVQHVDLSKITRSCKRLQNLKTFYVSGIDVRSFEHSLIYAVNLKVLSVTLNCKVPASETFFDSLGKCENLESLFLDGIKIDENNQLEHFLDTIFKLKNLFTVSFGTGYSNRVTIKSNDVYKKIVEERAAFFINFSSNWLYTLPEKQWQLR